MQIVSLNWWQNAGRVGSHANSAQPPNLHLTPKLKINMAHWNNSLHIGGTWYCPSDPYTSSVCPPLAARRAWHEACPRPESAPFLPELHPTPGGQHCLVQLWWKEGHPCLGSRLTFDPKHAQSGPCLDSKLASPWPQHPNAPKGLPCHVLYGAGHFLGRTQSCGQTPPSPIATFASPGMPVHGSIHHDQLTPPRMTECSPYHEWRATISISRLDAGINQPLPLPTAHPEVDRHWGTGRTGTHNWRYSVHCLRSSVSPPPLTGTSPVLHTTKVSLGHRAGRRYQYPAARSRLRMVRTDICLPNRWIICIRRQGAEMKRFVLTIRSSWRSSCGVEIFIEPPRFLWCGRPVPRLRRKILLMHPWDTPSILAISRWELPSAHNLTIS